MSVHVALIRSGATLYDEQERVQGCLDLPLSARGRAESQQLAASLANSGMSAIYCGPSECMRQTAQIIADAAGLRPRVMDELRNLDQGLWQGLQIEEVRRRNLKLFRQWLEDPLTICPPQGETVADALDRVKSALKSLWRRHRGQLIGIVITDPLAQVVAHHLRGLPRPQFEDELRTGCFETIEVNSTTQRNGSLVGFHRGSREQ